MSNKKPEDGSILSPPFSSDPQNMVPGTYKRVLLKLSGEALGERCSIEGTDCSDSMKDLPQTPCLDPFMLAHLAANIKEVYDLGIQIGIVIGGGNIFRGVSGSLSCHIDRVTSDSIGMLATVINALAFQDVLENIGVPCRVLSSILMPSLAEPYHHKRAINHFKKNRVVIFAGGTGTPFFTTDTAAAVRASETHCNLLLKATKVKGVYSADPLTDKKAKFYKTLTYEQVIQQHLQVMDLSAITLMQEQRIPIAVFSIYEAHGFASVLKNQGQYTLIST